MRLFILGAFLLSLSTLALTDVAQPNHLNARDRDNEFGFSFDSNNPFKGLPFTGGIDIVRNVVKAIISFVRSNFERILKEIQLAREEIQKLVEEASKNATENLNNTLSNPDNKEEESVSDESVTIEVEPAEKSEKSRFMRSHASKSHSKAKAKKSQKSHNKGRNHSEKKH